MGACYGLGLKFYSVSLDVEGIAHEIATLLGWGEGNFSGRLINFSSGPIIVKAFGLIAASVHDALFALVPRVVGDE